MVGTARGGYSDINRLSQSEFDNRERGKAVYHPRLFVLFVRPSDDVDFSCFGSRIGLSLLVVFFLAPKRAVE